MIVENIIPRNMIINLCCTSVDNHIPRDDIFDYHPLRECNIYIICYDINRKEEGKSYWNIPLSDDDATREKKCTQLVITFQYFMY